MTNKEIEKRLDALENWVLPEGTLSIWVRCFDKNGQMEIRGWRHHEGQTFLREPDETDEALHDRVLASTDQDKNQLFIQIT